MTKLIATTLAVAMLTSAPALAEPEAKTELVGHDGQRVQALPLKYDFHSAWVVDTQRVLYRDYSQQYYLVTLKAACSPLAIKGRSAAFFPDPQWRLQAKRSYEIRPLAGEPCDVAQIAKIADSQASPLRENALHRIW